MAYNLEAVGGYGSGTLGNVTNPAGQICSYANVVTVTEVAGAANAITIGVPSEGMYEKFEEGNEIFIHASACIGGESAEYLGCYMAAKIIGTQESTQGTKILLLSQNITKLMPVGNIGAHILQAITIPQFDTLTVSGTISPPAYDVTKKYGGILPIKCRTVLILSGSGRINLTDKGIPVANKILRYWTKQEYSVYNATNVAVSTSGNGLLDTDLYSGWENHGNFTLNAGDGACAVWARNFTNADASVNTRIGSTYAGVQFYRGAKDSVTYNETAPKNVTHIGGSSILLAAEKIEGFVPSLISKYRSTASAIGQGLGRCYIASGTKLRTDEGLYSYDCLSAPNRLMKVLGIKNFGDGRLGNLTNPEAPLNNYARVTNVSMDGKTITYAGKTTNGLAKIEMGAMVMFHAAKHTDTVNLDMAGRFVVAKVLSDDGTKLVLDTPITKNFDIAKATVYNCQIVSVAQFQTLTISTDYTATKAWDDVAKIGGICAVACQTNLNLKGGGKLNVEKKGGGTAYGREGLAYIGNAQMNNVLPLGQGHGSVFVLAKNIDLDENSRIGATYDGSTFGGAGTSGWGNMGKTGGYKGITTNPNQPGGDGAGSHTDDPMNVFGRNNQNGGYGSNGNFNESKINELAARQGAHIFCVADQMPKFIMACFSCGGSGCCNKKVNISMCGGSGYGGGGEYQNKDFYGGSGGFNAGGGAWGNGVSSGGATGWCFLYVNSVDTLDDSGVKI